MPPCPLALRRLTLGYRQEDLGALAGIHREHVSRLERGLNRPRVDTAMRLARALDCTPMDLFPLNDQDRAANPVLEKERDDASHDTE